MRRYLFIYYKTNDLRSKTIVSVCMYIVYMCGRVCVYLYRQPHPIKTSTLEKIQNQSGKKKYLKKNKIHSVWDGICRVNNSVFIENPLKQLAHKYLYNNRFLTSFIIVHAILSRLPIICSLN